MKIISLVLFFVFALAGCTKSDQPQQTSSAEPDNTGRNVRDRGGETMTPTDQGESEADRGVTQRVREIIVADGSLSGDAHNVKIITVDGVVTLRGPVKNEQEKNKIESEARKVEGVKKVDNQLEVTG